VFSEFLDPSISALPRPRPGDFPLTIILNGFSKMFSLPGWKVGWMAMDGDSEPLGGFLRALEFLSDTFLPVPEFTQAVIPGILQAGDPVVSGALAREYSARSRLALEALRCPVYAPDGGVYLCGRLPEGRDEEEFCVRALRENRVFVHPGYYYNLPPGHVVFTCVSCPERLREGIERLNRSLG
jgi:alanine-synthesizing transaminase